MGLREVSLQAVRQASATQQDAIGALVTTDDGKVYRYVKNGATALTPGTLVVNADEVAHHTNIAVAVAVKAGATRVKVTLGATATTADQYKDGYLTVSDAVGEGISYRIASHGVIASGGAGWIELAEPVVVALTTASEVSLSSPYSGVVISATDQADLPVGVPNVAIPADNFGYVQARGICAVLADEAVTKGSGLTIGTGVAGAVEAIDLIGEVLVGTAVNALVDTEYRSVDLCIV